MENGKTIIKAAEKLKQLKKPENRVKSCGNRKMHIFVAENRKETP